MKSTEKIWGKKENKTKKIDLGLYINQLSVSIMKYPKLRTL
jgi:hypothetical protein